MKIEWDPTKARVNLKKHGVPFQMKIDIAKKITLSKGCSTGSPQKRASR